LMPRYFKVKNFERFQHYKDRNPVWIKLYNELLDDYEFGALPDHLKGQLLLIWLLASRMENKIPFDAAWVAKRINANSDVDLDALAGAGFIEPWESGDAFGKREEWPSRWIHPDVRERVMERDNHRCVACGSADHLEIDHIIPISRGGTGDIENLQVLCRSCNRSKRAKPAEQVATQVRSPEKRERERREETEKENTRATRFVPPTVEQVSSYVKESGLKVDAEAFVDYFTSNGWKVGGKAPMKSWESAARTWDRRQRSNGSSDSSVPYV
jgi:hypothetical protein